MSLRCRCRRGLPFLPSTSGSRDEDKVATLDVVFILELLYNSGAERSSQTLVKSKPRTLGSSSTTPGDEALRPLQPGFRVPDSLRWHRLRGPLLNILKHQILDVMTEHPEQLLTTSWLLFTRQPASSRLISTSARASTSGLSMGHPYSLHRKEVPRRHQALRGGKSFVAPTSAFLGAQPSALLTYP